MVLEHQAHSPGEYRARILSCSSEPTIIMEDFYPLLEPMLGFGGICNPPELLFWLATGSLFMDCCLSFIIGRICLRE